jgi:tetratricopeptide (TPR) repeat protein
MSPERFANDVRQVDHRCDVYALGVVGFELLTGTLPIDVRNSSILEAVRAVEQQSPTSLGNVVPSLRGDVEVIIGKALEKDPDRRYQSARELADDICRYMNDQPILARPASAAYRLRKFVSRHRTIVGGIAATITALVFGLVLYAAEARQARTEAAKSQYEADKAMAINNFMTNDFFTMLLTAAQTDPAGERLPVSEMINTAAAGIPEMFSDRPAIEAAVRNEVGTINYNIGSLDQAAEQYEAALQLWESELGPEHPDTLKAVNNLGQVSLRLGLGDDAERLYRRALQGRLNALGESNPYTLATMNNLAELLRGTGRIDQAEVMLRRAYQLQLATSGPDDKQTLIVMANLGSLLAQREHYAEAADLHRTVFETMRRTLGNKHITTLHAQRELSLSLYRLEEFQQAKDLLMPVLHSFEQAFGAAHGETIMARRLMSRIERKSGNIATARDHLNAALTAAKTNSKQLGPLIPKIEQDLKRLKAYVP